MTIERALSLIADRTDEKAQALLPVVLTVYTKVAGTEAVRKRVEVAGLRWAGIDQAELRIAEARKAASSGDWKRARELLELLPAGTFQQRDAQAALMQARGAERLAQRLPDADSIYLSMVGQLASRGDVSGARVAGAKARGKLAPARNEYVMRPTRGSALSVAKIATKALGCTPIWA